MDVKITHFAFCNNRLTLFLSTTHYRVFLGSGLDPWTFNLLRGQLVINHVVILANLANLANLKGIFYAVITVVIFI